MASTDNLESELQVAKNVIRILTQDLLEARKEIQALKVSERTRRDLRDVDMSNTASKAKKPAPLGVWVSEEYTDRHEHAPELEIPDFARAEIDAALVDSKLVCAIS